MGGKFRLLFSDFFRSMHQLWLEVIGALFLALAVIFGLSAVQEFRRYSAAQDSGLWVFAAATALSLVTLAFGIHSFWKARKLR
jgi:hypothetical protein